MVAATAKAVTATWEKTARGPGLYIRALGYTMPFIGETAEDAPKIANTATWAVMEGSYGLPPHRGWLRRWRYERRWRRLQREILAAVREAFA